MSKSHKIVYIGNKLTSFGNTPTSIDTLGTLLEQEGYELVYGGQRKNKLSRLWNMLSTIYRHRTSANVVLIDTYSTAAFYYAWLSGWLCSKLQLKYIPILHGGNLPERLKQSENMCSMLLGDSFTNVVVSKYLEHHVQKVGYKTVLIPNTIELKEYPFKKRETSNPKLLWVRSFDDIYNPILAVKIVSKLKKTYPEISLTMVGPDKDGSLEHCKQFAENEGVDITFTGKLSKQEWVELSKDADIFLNTSNYDNMPVSIIEAMALGMPVVSTNVGGVPFMIEDKQNGLLFERDNVNEACNAIAMLLENSDMAANLSEQGRSYAAQFDWGVVKQKWDELFKSIND